MFGSAKLLNFKFSNDNEWSKSYSLMKEFEILGFYLSGHPLDQYKDKYSDLNLKNFDEIKDRVTFEQEFFKWIKSKNFELNPFNKNSEEEFENFLNIIEE